MKRKAGNVIRPKNTNDEKDISFIKGGRSFYMTLILCLIIFFAAIALLIAAFNRLISRHDQKLSGEICTLMSEKMNSSIEFMTETTHGMASVLSAQAFNSPKDIYNVLKGNTKADYLSVGFIDAAMHIYATPEEMEEFEKWELLETAKVAHPVSMSAPYRSSVFGQPVITLFSDFQYGNNQRGYMFTTYLLKDLQEVAVTESLGDKIEIWLMDANSANTIQCVGADEHATGSWTNAYLTMQNVSRKDVNVYEDWLKRVRNLEDNIGTSYSTSETFYSQYCSKISSLPGWYVVVRIPGDALSATMTAFRTYIFLFLAVLLVVVIVLIGNMYRLSKRDNEMLKSLSIHDPLTGAFNRRAFDLAAEKLLFRGKNSGRSCALIFFDIDYFKQVNDQFGHDAGDQLLIAFCDALRKNFSDTGIIARFGGDEFVVLTEMENIRAIASKLDQTTEDVHAIDLNDDKHEGRGFMISFSAGAANFPDDSADLSGLKKCADAALYETKEKGRNGYLWYSEIGSSAPPKKKVVKKIIRKKIIKKTVKTQD
ncbi:MAG: GGDEF domain-containing protein [Lachnospiraceae bacterium]|nr:GGDEF domain-containing protein [Lachnospiraceae bacterium]